MNVVLAIFAAISKHVRGFLHAIVDFAVKMDSMVEKFSEITEIRQNSRGKIFGNGYRTPKIL